MFLSHVETVILKQKTEKNVIKEKDAMIFVFAKVPGILMIQKIAPVIQNMLKKYQQLLMKKEMW